MILQLNPALPLDTPKGLGDAHLVIDYGSKSPILYVVFLRESGECWVFDNRVVKLEKNITGGVRVAEQTSTS